MSDTKKYPFKFLDSYKKEDNGIFFGRDDEIKLLYEMVFQSQILLIYGASGTGKTSLINCGLAGKFQSYDWRPLSVRRGNNINDSLKRTLDEAGGSAAEEEEDMKWLKKLMNETEEAVPLSGAIAKSIKAVYQQSFKPIYLIFDQFEELFVLGDKTEQDIFIKSVLEILQSEQPVKMIFSIREEYLGHLNEFESAVPQLLQKKLRIEPMGIEKVRQVIEGAADYKDSNIQLEQPEESGKLAKVIFDKIKEKDNSPTIQLPFLQVFMDRFYFEITGDKDQKKIAILSEDKLVKMEKIGDILRDFLEEQLTSITTKLKTKYPKPELTETMVWKILSPFATEEGTKKPIRKQDLYNSCPGIETTLIDDTVNEFKDKRILHNIDDTDTFELAHDSLARRIAEKRSVEETELLEIKAIIKRKVSVNVDREYFTEKQLLKIDTYLEKYEVSPEERDWIDKSHRINEEQKRKEQDQLLKEQMAITAIEEAKKTKKQLKKTYFLLGVATIGIIAAGLALFYANVQRKAANEQREAAKKAQYIAENSLKESRRFIDQVGQFISSVPDPDSSLKRNPEFLASLERINSNIATFQKKSFNQNTTDSISTAKKLEPGSKARGGIVVIVYESNNNGLIADDEDLDRKFTWNEANDKLKTLNSQNYKGCNDWRLPTQTELWLIWDWDSKSVYFKGADYWSSQESGSTRALHLNFSGGGYRGNTSKSTKFNVHLVREF